MRQCAHEQLLDLCVQVEVGDLACYGSRMALPYCMAYCTAEDQVGCICRGGAGQRVHDGCITTRQQVLLKDEGHCNLRLAIVRVEQVSVMCTQ